MAECIRKKRKVYAFQRSYREPPKATAQSYDLKPQPWMHQSTTWKVSDMISSMQGLVECHLDLVIILPNTVQQSCMLLSEGAADESDQKSLCPVPLKLEKRSDVQSALSSAHAWLMPFSTLLRQSSLLSSTVVSTRQRHCCTDLAKGHSICRNLHASHL